jgi:hypothetical protein
MTPGRRLAAAGAAAVLAAISLTGPARAESLGAGWEGSFTDDAVVDGYRATGTELVLPVTFTGPPGAQITDVTVDLTPVSGDDCEEPVTFNQEVGQGDGADTPETPTTPPEEPPTPPPTPTTPTTASSARQTVSYTFRVDPECNGTYDVDVFASTDPPGPGEPGDPGTESGRLQVDDVRVSLAPPAPAQVAAEAAADRTVTVRWQAPPAWTGPAPPRDAIGFQVRRISADGTAAMVADQLAPNQTVVVDDDLVGAPDGRYRYRVVAVRADASGAPVTSEPGETSLDLVGPGTGGTGPGTGAGAGGAAGPPPAGGVVIPGGAVGQPAVSDAPFDPGFDPQLDYSEAELGDEEAVPPSDSGVFDIGEDSSAEAGLVVPGAVALCLACWAGHLRHLARRATPPAG